VLEDETDACNDSTWMNCTQSANACATVKISFVETNGKESDEMVGKLQGYVCAMKPAKNFEGTACKFGIDNLAPSLPSFKDFKCSSKYCETDLCNAGNAAQLSSFMLTATIGLFGILL
jgi:hypothetical protein